MSTMNGTTIPVAVRAAKARIDTAIDALLALRNLAFDRPDIANDISLTAYSKMLVFVGDSEYASAKHRTDVAARIAEIAKAAGRHGAILRPEAGDKHGGVLATFGPFAMYIYAPLAQVGSSATREVTEWQLDPRLAAFGTEAAK